MNYLIVLSCDIRKRTGAKARNWVKGVASGREYVFPPTYSEEVVDKAE